LIVSLVSLSVLAQTQSQTKSRGLAVEDNADALSVKVYKAVRDAGGITKSGAALNLSDPNLSFRSGELITVSYGINFDGYLYFVNVGPEGTRVIFPTNDAGIAPVVANSNHEVTLRLNEYTGREELILVVARGRLSRLDEAIRSSSKVLDQQTTSVPPTTNNDPQQPGPNSPNPSGQNGSSSPVTPTPNQPLQPSQPVQPSPKKESRRGQLGIIAGGIAMELLNKWLNPSPSGSAGASGGSPPTRGLEVEQSDGNVVRASPSPGDNGNVSFGAGQVAAFRISFDHH
jgi:hypothetical protein